MFDAILNRPGPQEGITEGTPSLLSEVETAILGETGYKINIWNAMKKHPNVSAAVVLTVGYVFYSVISTTIGILGFGAAILSAAITPAGISLILIITAIYFAK